MINYWTTVGRLMQLAMRTMRMGMMVMNINDDFVDDPPMLVGQLLDSNVGNALVTYEITFGRLLGESCNLNR